jgi:Zn finger protein HypA/HybF involved in hydrogenase expression
MKAGTKEYYSEYYNQNKEKRNAKSLKWHSQNKDKAAESVKNWQLKNPDKVKEYDRLRKREQTKQRRAFMDEYKLKCSCAKCNDSRPYVLDFHHIDPSTKLFNLGDASKKGIKTIEEELKKCITLCRNCHSEFHYLEKEQNINIIDYLKNYGII